MRFSLNLVLMASVVATGCTAVPSGPSGNPFDEPIVKATPLYTQRSAPESKAVIQRERTADLAAPDERNQLPFKPSEAVVVTPQPIAQRAVVITENVNSHPGKTSLAAEMIAEANRLGNIGDERGKASVLEGAGYAGSADAFYSLAQMYQDGSLPKSDDSMFRFLTLAQRMGHVEAGRVLGHLYLLGMGAPHDEGYGRKLLERAAKSSPRAAREYGQMLANQRKPHLNEPDLAVLYLRSAYEQGDESAILPLAEALDQAGMSTEALVLRAHAEELEPPEIGVPTAKVSLKDQAMRGDLNAMFDYAQNVLIRKIPDATPELTSYCWLSVAKELGHEPAARELRYIEGVRSSVEKTQPGIVDQCIHDLHYQITGRDVASAPGSLED